jgi:hypothetical protein
MSNAHRPQHAMPLSCVFTHLHSHLAIKGLATNWLLLNKTKKKQYRPMKLQRRLGKRGFEGEKETGRVKHPKKKEIKKRKEKQSVCMMLTQQKKKTDVSLHIQNTKDDGKERKLPVCKEHLRFVSVTSVFKKRKKVRKERKLHEH